MGLNYFILPYNKLHVQNSWWWMMVRTQVVQFTRGNRAMLFINVATSTFNGPLYNTLLPPGRYCNVYKSGCEVVKIDANGATVGSVTVPQDSAIALHVNAMASGAAAEA